MTCLNRRVLACSLILALCALPAFATDVYQGLDLLWSQSGTAIDFSDNPLPANFFPGCGLPFAGLIPVQGVRIVADKNLGNTDTVLARLNDVPGGDGVTQLLILTVCLKKDGWVDPCGQSWDVTVRLAPGGQQMTYLQMTAGGVFDAWVSVNGEVTFTDPINGDVLTAIDYIDLITYGAGWSTTPGPMSVTVAGPVNLDTDCDGTLDLYVPFGTSNFHPTGLVNHSGPHPVKRAKKAIQAEPIEVEPIETEPIEVGEPGGTTPVVLP